MAEVLVVMVTADELLATSVDVAVIPVGADAAVIPSVLVNQAKVPVVPAATLVVFAAKAADPAVPLLIVPTWGPRLTVAVIVVPPVKLEHPPISGIATNVRSPNIGQSLRMAGSSIDK